MTNIKNKKRVLIMIMILMAVFFSSGVLNRADAAGALPNPESPKINTSQKGILDCLFDPLDCMIDVVVGLVAYISSLFLTLAGFLVNLSLKMNQNLNSGIVISGWNITNALTNLGFVLALIVIAFATILRFQSYSYKQTLFKLIAAALLVNFSLLIAFVFIDFSTVLTTYFLSAMNSNKLTQTANALAKSFEIPAIQKVAPPSATSTLAVGATEVTIRIASVFFQIAFNFILFLTLLAIASMLFVRYIVLVILLILAPLAWLFWILPFTSKWWNQWWDSFIKWVIFAPAVTFFIFLAIELPKNMAIKTLSGEAAYGMKSGVSIDGFFTQIGNMTVMVGLLIGGLMTANKMGIAGAAMFYKAVQKTGKAAQGYVGRTAARGGSYPLRTEAGRKLTEKLQQAGSSSNRFVRAISRPLRSVGSAIAGGRIAAENYNMKAAKKSLADLSHQELARRYDTSSGPQKAHILSALAKAKKMSLLPRDGRKKFIKESKKYSTLYGQHETFQKTRTVKVKNASGEEMTFDLPDDEKIPEATKEASKLTDQFGRPIT